MNLAAHIFELSFPEILRIAEGLSDEEMADTVAWLGVQRELIDRLLALFEPRLAPKH